MGGSKWIGRVSEKKICKKNELHTYIYVPNQVGLTVLKVIVLLLPLFLSHRSFHLKHVWITKDVLYTFLFHDATERD